MPSRLLLLSLFVLSAGGLSIAAEGAGQAGRSEPVAYGAWHSCQMGGGGYLQNVVLCPSRPERLYTYVDVGGLYRSDDGGRRWQMLHGNWPAKPGCYEVRGVNVDPRDDRKVLAAVGSQWSVKGLGILASNDAGETWKTVLDATYGGNADYRWTGQVLARDPKNPDVVLTASMGGGAWRSEDNGATWKETGAKGLCPTDVRFDAKDPKRAWLCALAYNGWCGGKKVSLPAAFLRSSDGGKTWEKISDTSPSEILQDPVDAGRLYGIFDDGTEIRTSRDGGMTWTPFTNGLPPKKPKQGNTNEHEFQALAAGPDFIVTASTRGTFYRLACGTEKWEKIVRQGLEEIYEGEEWFRHKTGGFGWALASITVDPRRPEHWFFTDWFAIYQTFDAGKNWKLTIDGIEDTVIHTIVQDPSDPAVVHLGMADDGYLWSENGGARFHNDEKAGISNNIKCIAVAPTRPSRLYAVGPRQWAWEANQVFVSDNRGRKWTRPAMQGLPDMAKHHCDTIAVDPKDPEKVYLAVSLAVKDGGGGGGIYRSTDAGKTWTWFGDGLPAGKEFFYHEIWSVGHEIAIGEDGGMVCISRNQSVAYRYDAAARKWVAAGKLPWQPNDVVADPSKPGRFFAAAGGVCVSEDGGATWKKLYGGDVQHIAIDRTKPARLAAGTAEGVALSEDSGATWKMADMKLPHRIHNIVCLTGDRLLVGSGGSGAFWMPLTPAGAKPVKAK